MSLLTQGSLGRFTTYILVFSLVSLSILLVDLSGRHGGVSPLWASDRMSLEAPPYSVLQHPIRQLHDIGTRQFAVLIERQSQTLDAAVLEYRRRYKRPPPLGFDVWFDFAKKHSSVIIDDFDTISNSLAPFWNISPSSVRKFHTALGNDSLTWNLTIKAGDLTMSEENWMGSQIAHLLEEFDVKSHLPDLEIAMNPLDEPRILITNPAPRDRIRWIDSSRQSTWKRIHGVCSEVANRRRPDRLLKAPGHAYANYGIAFVSDVRSDRDLCHKQLLQHRHGFFIGPDTLITTNDQVPMFSQATASAFSDILYPSMYYWVRNKYEKSADPPWKQKANKLYWAGRTTGVHTKSDYSGHVESHRHRLVRLTNEPRATRAKNDSIQFLARTQERGWTSYRSDEVLLPLYDTQFTETVQCDGAACDDMKNEYKFGEVEPFNASFSSKLLVDIDGNSFSGRFYDFLKSNSCPLKITIFNEWHDDRLIPWVHYIPISVGREERPEAVRYLSLTTDGDAIAQKVAAMGQEWHDKVLRREDAAIYLFRLFLEYARVINDDRKSGKMDYMLSRDS